MVFSHSSACMHRVAPVQALNVMYHPAGDINLTKSEIEDTQIIVTTPEKW